MTSNEFKLLRKLSQFTEYQIDNNQHTLSIINVDNAHDRVQFQLKLNYEEIGLDNIQVLSHIIDDDYHKLYYYFEQNKKSYLIKITSDGEHYSSIAFEANNIKTMYEAMPIIKSKIYFTDGIEHVLASIIEKNHLETCLPDNSNSIPLPLVSLGKLKL